MSLNRRRFHAAALGGGALALGSGAAAARAGGKGRGPAAEAAAAPEAAGSPLRGPDRFRFKEATVAQLQAQMAAGTLSARTLAEAHLQRIRRIDQAGPRLNAVIELNPDALALADALDAERRAGRVRGPLHGIPVLLKDNIASADRMSTTAGSRVLQGVRSPRDAHLVQRLREAGALILGKTNLSEWANIRSPRSTSGWSSRGGLTRNPYALDRNTSGSSSGTAAAIAASLGVLGVGTETDGSITSPASINGLVGLKPTVGLVSRDGVIPISASQDTAGPMTRSVADAALLLGALAGPDARDAATAAIPAAQRAATDYTRFLQPGRLRGARLGVVRQVFGGHPGILAVMDECLALLKAQGAVLVDPVVLPHADRYGDAELVVLLHELKHGLARYLAEFAPGAPIGDLAGLVAWNRQHAAHEMRWFGQEFLEQALAAGGLDSPAYLDALATCRRYARDEGLAAVMAEHRLDALVAPTGGLAWLTDLVNGDHFGGSFSSPAAVAGWPHLTVPAGFVHGLPVGLSFVGPAFSEGLLLGLGHGFEQARQARRPPGFAATVPATLGRG